MSCLHLRVAVIIVAVVLPSMALVDLKMVGPRALLVLFVAAGIYTDLKLKHSWVLLVELLGV